MVYAVTSEGWESWLHEVCKRLSLSLPEAALRASVKKEDFDEWCTTGKPQHVTRSLRVWIKNLLQDAQVRRLLRLPPSCPPAVGSCWARVVPRPSPPPR